MYKQTADGVAFVTGGCIQVGEPGIQRTPIVRSFTLADGSPVVYPAQKDTAAVTLSLECTQAQAAEIEKLVHGAQIILTGIKAGALLGAGLQTADDYPAQSGCTAIITGAVDVTEKFARSGIYSVELPLQILVGNTGEAEPVTVPGLRFAAISLDGETGQFLPRYHTERARVLGAVRACWVRNSRYFTSSGTLDVTWAVASGNPTCTLYVNGAEIADATGAGGTFADTPLTVGDNEIVLVLTADGCRPLHVVIPVYRQNVG